MEPLAADTLVYSALRAEQERQQTTLCLIPSENHASPAVRAACASVLMNKYSEGYPGKRYYQGNAFVDEIESLAIERAKELFNAEHVNVQPYSGSTANSAVYLAFLKPGDTVLGLSLDSGGHLTHGSPVNFSGKSYRAVAYAVHPKTGIIDMAAVRALALAERPKLIISGTTAYSRTIDFAAFQAIADEVGAIHLADISHIAGLVAAGVHPSPFPFTDVVMFTTHKTLRGPRGAVLCCLQKYASAIDRAVFPGTQGGPHDNITAAKAICFQEALAPAFSVYAQQVVRNAQTIARVLAAEGFSIVSGGTDNHLFVVDCTPKGIGLGRQLAVALESVGIIVNANTIPNDPSTPFSPSGIRFGTPAITSRGFTEKECELLGKVIGGVLHSPTDEATLRSARETVALLAKQFPVP